MTPEQIKKIAVETAEAAARAFLHRMAWLPSGQDIPPAAAIFKHARAIRGKTFDATTAALQKLTTPRPCKPLKQ